MTDWQEHLIIGPIVLPMVIAAAMLLFDERRRLLKGGLSLFAMAAILAMALALLHESATGATGGGDTARVYQLGDWPAPFGAKAARASGTSGTCAAMPPPRRGCTQRRLPAIARSG